MFLVNGWTIGSTSMIADLAIFSLASLVLLVQFVLRFRSHTGLTNSQLQASAVYYAELYSYSSLPQPPYVPKVAAEIFAEADPLFLPESFSPRPAGL